MSYNGEMPFDVEGLRERLRDMSDAELLAYGEACKELCSPATNFGKPPMEAFVMQLEEARAVLGELSSSLKPLLGASY